MKKTLIKIVLYIVLIPVLGIGLPFGGAYIYGRIQWHVHFNRAENVLRQNESDLAWWVEDTVITWWGKNPVIADHFPIPEIQSIREEDGAMLFAFPYEAKPFNWVPCGILYCEDTTRIERWRKIEPLHENWFFYWDTN